jgi:hypothetical protein
MYLIGPNAGKEEEDDDDDDDDDDDYVCEEWCLLGC